MSSALSLFCYILGDDPTNIFCVDIEPSKTVSHLRDAIKAKTSHAFKEVDAKTLKLWKVSIAVDSSFKERIETSNFVDEDSLQPATRLSKLFSDSPLPEEHVHIVVKLPFDRRNKKRPIDEVQDVVERWASKRHKNTLPSLEELRGVLKEPLPDSDKIPVTRTSFETLISSLGPDTCTPNDIGNLFTIGEPNLALQDLWIAVCRSAPTEGTEEFFHHFWDDNIRTPLELLIPTGRSIRNGNRHTQTNQLRPDYGFLLNDVCLVRGEEKGPENKEDPKEELADKLNWVYDDAPYVFGYYCSGTAMTLAAITAPTDATKSKPAVHDLISLDLRWRKSRIANIRHLISLSAIVPQLNDLVRSPVDDFRIFEGQNSRVEITSKIIVKTYTCQGAEERVSQLRQIYEILANAAVPNTDILTLANGNVAHLSPRGIAVKPQSQRELRECLFCILESLVVAHRVPIYHRDIRRDNVIRKMDDKSKWFLIDWEDAAVPSTKARPTFSKSDHSPAIFSDGHGAEVDIWAIGYLIKTCRAMDISPDLKKLGERICQESESLSAEEVLVLVNNCP